MTIIEKLFKWIFVDYTSIIDFSITENITTVTWKRFDIVFSETYDTKELFVNNKKVKRDSLK